jgi:hypothetical protein
LGASSDDQTEDATSSSCTALTLATALAKMEPGSSERHIGTFIVRGSHRDTDPLTGAGPWSPWEGSGEPGDVSLVSTGEKLLLRLKFDELFDQPVIEENGVRPPLLRTCPGTDTTYECTPAELTTTVEESTTCSVVFVSDIWHWGLDGHGAEKVDNRTRIEITLDR